MEDHKSEIIKRIGLFYDSKEKAKTWYERPHMILSIGERQILSPKDFVDRGDGQTVLDFIKIALDR